jgi:hypothetical protein
MATEEQEIVRQILVSLVERFRVENVGFYEAMRIMGYVMVALAEAIDEPDDHGRVV